MDNALTFKTADAGDIDTLARTIWAEAEGEGLAGMIAVGFTVAHRAKIAANYAAAHDKPHALYGDGSLRQACKAPWQYSCWNPGTRRIRAVEVMLGDPELQMAYYTACGIANRLLSDAMPTVTHYYNPKAVDHTPAWVTGKPATPDHAAVAPAHFIGSIGNHRFYDQVAA